MGLIIELNNSQAYDYFRETIKNRFSMEAFDALFEYYEELSEEIDENIFIDVIAWSCDWVEYSFEDALKDFRYLFDSEDLIDITQCELIDLIRAHTSVLEVESSETFLVQNF